MLAFVFVAAYFSGLGVIGDEKFARIIILVLELLQMCHRKYYNHQTSVIKASSFLPYF